MNDEQLKEHALQKISSILLEYGIDVFKLGKSFTISFLSNEEFSKLGGSNIKGGGYSRNYKTIYFSKKETYNDHDLHNLIHEMLHAYSDNYFYYGKAGLECTGFDELNHKISAGGAINEAATEYLTAIISGDGFIGYPDDMKYIFELFLDILDIKTGFISTYFQEEQWITDEMNFRFSSSIQNQLDEFILEFDNRLPQFRKKTYDFNRVMNLLLNSLIEKLQNNVNIDYSDIYKNLSLIKNSDFELNPDVVQKIEEVKKQITQTYGVFKENTYKDIDIISNSIKRL